MCSLGQPRWLAMAHHFSNKALGSFFLLSFFMLSCSTFTYGHSHFLLDPVVIPGDYLYPPGNDIGVGDPPAQSPEVLIGDAPAQSPEPLIGDSPAPAPAPAAEIECENRNMSFPNERLKHSYVAFQAWKKAIYSDPFNTTANWVGHDVCSYNGVFCSPALDDPTLNVVAGVDLNHADIAGHLPEELGLLNDTALFHINSNRFCGIIPDSFENLTIMHEFDISNNRFVGEFPLVVLKWKNLKFLDIRFNDFEGVLPPELFEKELDAIFLNNNRFTSHIPETLGNSTASVVSFANNHFTGCIPKSIGHMVNLNEIVFLGNSLGGCFPQEIGLLGDLTVLDASKNGFVGTLPNLAGLKNVEVIEIAHNKLSGYVSNTICQLPLLTNFTFSYNYFNGEAQACVPSKDSLVVLDDAKNCLPGRKNQKTAKQCLPVLTKPVDCSKNCGGGKGKSHAPSTPKPTPSNPPKIFHLCDHRL
ncbi:variant 3 [Lathyrus oleraceus]|uniref:Cell wall hydroxyproline-rich glycoprotein n=1 Tax=Pisum sativum TaxID=3888 RepID=A0A9D4W8Q7_PEA|nr:variant 3 [Pisum sativum]